jgi:hypothetical protein
MSFRASVQNIFRTKKASTPLAIESQKATGLHVHPSVTPTFKIKVGKDANSPGSLRRCYQDEEAIEIQQRTDSTAED